MKKMEIIIPEGYTKVETGEVKSGYKIFIPKDNGEWRDANETDYGMAVSNYYCVIVINN